MDIMCAGIPVSGSLFRGPHNADPETPMYDRCKNSVCTRILFESMVSNPSEAHGLLGCFKDSEFAVRAVGSSGAR